MAHPHYLMQAASGRYVFRIRVPSPMRTKVWRAFLKRSLGMDLLPARVAALALSARHAAAFTAMQKMGMSKEDVGALVARLRKGRLPDKRKAANAAKQGKKTGKMRGSLARRSMG